MKKYEVTGTDGVNVFSTFVNTEYELQLLLRTEVMAKVILIFIDNKDVTKHYKELILSQNLKYHTAEIDRIKEIIAKKSFT